MSVTTDRDNTTGDGRVQFSDTVKFQRKQENVINCSEMYSNTLKLEALQLKKLEMEILLLEMRSSNTSYDLSLDDDW
jgi:hypothetical protein